ncbi:hypothetical protein A2U01_0053267, partial [Trifolium medium]|nr:hypothetical protein [Trifolium medium]
HHTIPSQPPPAPETKLDLPPPEPPASTIGKAGGAVVDGQNSKKKKIEDEQEEEKPLAPEKKKDTEPAPIWTRWCGGLTASSSHHHHRLFYIVKGEVWILGRIADLGVCRERSERKKLERGLFELNYSHFLQ